MWCNYKFTPQYCGPQNCGPTRIDRFLVAFGRVLQNLVAFGRIFRSLFGYTGDSINHLIDKTFDSHQEYTIATSSLAPARGTAPDPQPAAVINPCSSSWRQRCLLSSVQWLPLRRGEIRCASLPSGSFLLVESIHPKQSASSTISRYGSAAHAGFLLRYATTQQCLAEEWFSFSHSRSWERSENSYKGWTSMG